MFLFQYICCFILLSNVKSLICPIYNLYNNESNTCDNNSSLCTYIQTQSNDRRCLGIYTFNKNLKSKENSICIRQLALVDDYEEKYYNLTECILDIDRTGNNLLCRCNTDNCTLNWKINQTLYKKIHLLNQEYNNWFIPLIILFFIIINIIIFILILNHCWYKKTKEKNREYFFENLSSTSTNISHTEIDEFLSSNPTYESIISRNKTNIIYQASITGKENLQHVAIKLYSEQQYKNIFENELQTLKLIHHSTIINFISYGWFNLSPYIIFEYYDLGSLNHYLYTHKLSWSICYSFLNSLLDAIDYLHYEAFSSTDYLTSNRLCKPIIIHRDIKSSNILIKSKPNLTLCLSDFGLAKILPTILTPSDFIQIGTYRYMAPELLELAITHTSDALCKVDMYALGLVMWEIVTQCQEYPCKYISMYIYIYVLDMKKLRILD